MAVAEIIGAAIGVLLLIIVAYLLVGNVIATAEIVTFAQKDVTLQNEARLNTGIILGNQSLAGNVLNFSVVNTGNEEIFDFEHMDVYSWDGATAGYQTYRYDESESGATGTWFVKRFESDYIHPKTLDPGETMWCNAIYSGTPPVWLKVSTSNGVYTSAYI